MHMLAAARGTGRLVNSSSRRCRIEVRSLQADRMDADGRQLLRLTSSATHSRSLSTAAVAPRRPSTAPTTISTNTSATSYNTSSSSASARLSQLNNHIPNKVSNISTALKYSTTATTTSDKMSAQAEHPTVLIPGPIEFDDAVLQAMSTPSESHVGMPFVHVFGDTLTQLRQLFITSSPDSQPLILSGSGTLGWDVVASNIIEPGDEVLVLHTGYFGDSFSDCLATYGAKPTQLGAPIGSRPSPQEIEDALKGKKYKAVTITHTDTSTGVLSDPKEVAEVVKRVSPETLVVVDGVCSVGCEEIRFDEWGLDVVLTASQKAVGVPAGLSIMMLSGRAIEAYKSRKVPPGSYYASLKNWLPIMQNYEAKKPSYFATPSPQLVRALNTSLTQILSVPLSQRFEEHKAASKKIKDAVTSFGLKQLASEERFQAHGMTAVWLPEGLTPADILPHTAKEGVVFAGGLHKQAATKYIRIGSMGVSVVSFFPFFPLFLGVMIAVTILMFVGFRRIRRWGTLTRQSML
ncbi:hypothetical protein TWF225_000883 [Orbilia oligospora]|nr:hypothetical protein TWF225_000883 [Orbilia oligospora]KAF3234743.1 hypothetical protein TWF217_003416 [Orbilia oligospora]KAF3234783.1 hypothetical protein TWF128_002238 [Orbilia oligospora]KAF3274205.1 hypothetical protein TWF132_003781 [Orbilia oligospora]